ncbi:MAG: ribokinase [Microbacteriaceae bacterium]|nr:MAG: ribokinase [Microbacteriaceae bacterium]
MIRSNSEPDPPRQKARIVVVGSLNADVTIRTQTLPRAGETVRGHGFQTFPGGKGANQAVAAALLGGDVVLIGAVGRDDHGELLDNALDRAGVDRSGLFRSPNQATGMALITVDDAGENTIVLASGANSVYLPEQARFVRATVAAHSIVGLSLEIPLGMAADAARFAQDAGATVVLNLSPYTADIDEILLATDVIVVNEHEAAELAREAGAAQQNFTRIREKYGFAAVIVTRGSAGCSIYTHQAHVDIPAAAADAIDTTGCGDAFFGAMLVSLSDGKDFVEAASFAGRVAAFAAEGVGAQPSYPTPATLEKHQAARPDPLLLTSIQSEV